LHSEIPLDEAWKTYLPPLSASQFAAEHQACWIAAPVAAVVPAVHGVLALDQAASGGVVAASPAVQPSLDAFPVVEDPTLPAAAEHDSPAVFVQRLCWGPCLADWMQVTVAVGAALPPLLRGLQAGLPCCLTAASPHPAA